MEEKPFFTAEDISGAEGTYGQIALSEWWGGDIAYSSIDFLNKDGEKLPVVSDDVTPGTSEDVEETVDVAIKNAGRTVVDSGLVRTNIINAWTGDDADVIAEKADFANAVKVKVQFTVSNFTTPFKAWISFADKDWGVQYWGEGNEKNANAEGTVVDVTGNGTYEVELTFANKIAAAEFIAVCTDLAAEEDATDIPTIAIDSVKIVVDNSTPEEPVNPGESSGDVPEPVKPGESSGETPKDPDKPVSPETGVAVAVVPAALAAAAVATAGIVLKKRSK